MSKVVMRMKNKMLSKVHLDSGGAMAITGTKATSDAASKGISAQPAGPLTEAENKGNPGLPPSQVASTKLSEPSTGAPAERVAPDSIPEKDVQPPMKDLSTAPSQLSPEAKAREEALVAEEEALGIVTPDATQPAPSAPAPAPHEKVPSAVADKVLVTESAADATIAKKDGDASDPLKG